MLLSIEAMTFYDSPRTPHPHFHLREGSFIPPDGMFLTTTQQMLSLAF